MKLRQEIHTWLAVTKQQMEQNKNECKGKNKLCINFKLNYFNKDPTWVKRNLLEFNEALRTSAAV
jgi:hypothetical protein